MAAWQTVWGANPIWFNVFLTLMRFAVVMEGQTDSLADQWIERTFAAKAVAKGGVVRRSIYSVEREVGRKRFVEEVRLRGFTLLEGGGQFIVICCRAPVRRLL